MIKCPKCEFEQPEDIYCAQCGVNMQTFRVQPTSQILKLLKNQLVQLAILVIGIIGFVVVNSHRDRLKNTSQTASTSRQAPNRFSSQSATREAPSAPAAPAPQASAPTASAATPMAAAPARTRFRSAGETPAESAAASAAADRRFPRSAARVSFYRASRNALSELQRDAQVASFAGDANGGIVNESRIQQLITAKELRPLSANRYKLDPQHPVVIFKGQRSNEAAKNIGLYFQLTTLRSDANTTLEIRSWGALKLQDNDENFFSSEMTLNQQYAAFISGFLPKNKVFTDDEKSIFETDRTLQIYNSEDFWEGASDLVMIVELVQGP